jgi:BlaI family transcriptional regulator, penicillinase repressor
MAKKEERRLTPLEALIMDALWQKSPASVHQVQEMLQQKKKMAYNTVLTMMRILRDKGFLRSTREGRMDFYEPTVSRQHIGRRSLSDIIELFFSGSAGSVVSNLLDQEKISEEEMREIRRAIDEKLGGKNG